MRTIVPARIVVAAALVMAAGFATRPGLSQAPATPASPAPTALPALPALPDVQKLGPQAGSRVPDFTLPDQQGRPRSLRSLMGPKGLMLVFYRSADWCPYCKTQLAELQTRLPDLAKNGLGLAAVSYDPVPTTADFSHRRGITFPLLSDAGSATIKAYGIFNTTVPESNRQSYGIPFPGTFMLGPDGIVTARFFEQAYQERTTVGSILVRLGADVDAAATKITSPQLDVTAFTTDTTVAPGTHFSIVLDVRPGAGMHVYAPGAIGYRTIGLTLKPRAGVLTQPARYPAPEPYTFKPLNETVQVYQRPFKIVQDVTIDPSPQGTAALRGLTSVTIEGALSYQACDDKICFNPQTVPLAWTVALRPLDAERAKP